MPTPHTSIDSYISSFSPEIAERLRSIQKIATTVVPEGKGVIKYDMPMIEYHGNLIGYAGWKKHIALYPVTAQMLEDFPELLHYPTSGKGTIQFLHTKPLPLDLVEKIIRHRKNELCLA